MRNFILLILILTLITPAWAQAVPTAQVGRSQELIDNNLRLQSQINTPLSKVRIRAIVVEGFLLKDTKDLEKMLASYKNKSLTQEEIETLVRKVEDFYVQAGYSGMVQLVYKLQKKRLIITVSLINS
jgi:hemolysin activation/secretion protein